MPGESSLAWTDIPFEQTAGSRSGYELDLESRINVALGRGPSVRSPFPADVQADIERGGYEYALVQVYRRQGRDILSPKISVEANMPFGVSPYMTAYSQRFPAGIRNSFRPLYSSALTSGANTRMGPPQSEGFFGGLVDTLEQLLPIAGGVFQIAQGRRQQRQIEKAIRRGQVPLGYDPGILGIGDSGGGYSTGNAQIDALLGLGGAAAAAALPAVIGPAAGVVTGIAGRLLPLVRRYGLQAVQAILQGAGLVEVAQQLASVVGASCDDDFFDETPTGRCRPQALIEAQNPRGERVYWRYVGRPKSFEYDGRRYGSRRLCAPRCATKCRPR